MNKPEPRRAVSRTVTFEQVVIQYLNSSAKVRAVADVVLEFRVTNRQAYDALKQLACTGRAKRVGHGLYVGTTSPLPEAGPKRVIDWDAEPLGSMTDRDHARLLGVSAMSVCRARLKRRIPSYTGLARTAGASCDSY
jgi:hypothetical protein